MYTDIIIILLTIFLILKGAFRGFWFSLLTPISTIIGYIAALAYFKITDNILHAILIGVLGPIILFFLLRYILFCFIDHENKKYAPSFISGLLGSIVTVAWGFIFIVPLIYLLTFFPPINPTMVDINKDVKSSIVLKDVFKILNEKFLGEKKSDGKKSTIANETDSNSTKNLIKNPKIQDIINDPEIKAAAEAKDYKKLLSNKKIIAITQDPELVKMLLLEFRKIKPAEKSQDPLDAISQ
jgi:uncharacterized membrane protein required for colicin V production